MSRSSMGFSVVAGLVLLSPSVAAAQALSWRLAVPQGIEVNAAIQAWHSGRVQDVVDFLDGSVLVGTNGGGIWWANQSGEARVLSDSWDDPEITAVRRGPDGQYHVYVATTRGLRENRSARLDDWQTVPTPAGAVIRDIAILRGARRIVLATNQGVYWSRIPSPVGLPRLYSWRQATGAGGAVDFHSVAAQPTASAWGANERVTDDRLAGNPEIAAVSRSPIHRDLFWVGPAGDVRSAWHVRGGSWTGNTFSATNTGAAHARSRIAAVARNESHIDVFFVGPGGQVKTTWWDAADGNWRAHTYQIAGAGTAAIDSPLTAVSRTPDTLDVFWLNPDRALMHAGWMSSTGWRAPARVAEPGGAAADTKIAVASRAPDLLNVFWISPAGALKTNWWRRDVSTGWTNLYTIPSGGLAATGGGVAVVGRDADKLDVVWVASDGRLMTTWWSKDAPEHYVGHAYALTAPGAAVLRGHLSLVSRNPLHLDLVWKATDGTMRTNWWNRYSATSFGAQSYSLGRFEGEIAWTHTAISAFDEELSLFAVTPTGRVFAREWLNTDGFVLASRRGANAAPVLRGTWNGAGDLNLTTPTFNGGDGNYLSACVSHSRYGTAAYAVVADPIANAPPGDPTVRASVKYVFRSNDGGATWRTVGTATRDRSGRVCTLQTCSGRQGFDWNNTIAVSPVDNERVYVGWVGLFYTANGGGSWQQFANDHIHDDVPRVRFGEFDRSGSTTLFCTDGGLSATFDKNATFYSRFNERLATLQCYTTDGARQIDGTLGASYQVNNLIGAGLQDNGNVWTIHGAGPWKRIDGGDGGHFVFTRGSQVLRRISMQPIDQPITRGEWDGSALVDRGVVPIDRKKPGPNPPNSLVGRTVIVNAPVTWDAEGSRIHALGWSGADIYSFWNPKTGKGWRWDFEITAPLVAGEYISAGGSATGEIAFFGTSAGRILSYNRRTGRIMVSWVALGGVPSAANYGINRMMILSNTLGYALLNDWRGAGVSGYVLRYELAPSPFGVDVRRWAPIVATLTSGAALPVQRYWSIESDWTVSPNAILLASDDSIYRSTNGGQTWSIENTGLPRRGKLADLRFVVFPTGTKRFYLSTFGRSVWYADVR